LDRLGVAQFTVQDLKWVESSGEIAVPLVLAGQPRQMVLRKHSVRAPGFRLLAHESDGAWREVAVPESQTYRGQVTGLDDSSVAATIVDGTIRALVCVDRASGTTWVVEPLQSVLADAAASGHLVYNSADVGGEPGVCGNQDRPAVAPAGALSPEVAAMPPGVKVCRIACDADYEYFATNGSSVVNTSLDIETIINGVSAIYERDTQLTFQITQILVRSAEPDPYTSGNVDALLSEFRLDWQNNHRDIPRDVAQLFTGKVFGTILGNGYTDQVCPGLNHYSLVRSRWQTDLGKRIALSAHEIGHNFAAAHCDYDADPRCRIMCPNLGGCSNGYHSFEDSNVARIRARVARSACLTAGTVTSPTTTLPFSDNFASGAQPQAPNPAKWTAVDLAACEYGRLEISIGRDYNYNERLGTLRTLPMTLSGLAQVRYKVAPNGIPSTHALKVEYFETASFTWKNLRTIPGTNSVQYQSYEDAVPATAAGDYFAVRFSAYGTAFTSSMAWYVDDVSITQNPVALRLSIARTATNTVILSWPQPAPNWQLEATADLTGGAGTWTVIAPPYPTNTTQCVVTEALPVGNKFYRLRTP
jgi:hypothetical protein